MKSASQPQSADARTIEALNGLLRGELAAIETYTQAISKIDDLRMIPLQDLLDDHARQAMELRTRIIAVGGTPITDSGVWGTFARLVERSAALLSRHAAIAALEEGEDHGLRDYRAALKAVDRSTREWLEDDLLPSQIRTRKLISDAGRPDDRSTPGRGGGGPMLLMVAIISSGALALSGCQDKRKVSLDDVTLEARTTITKLVGSDQVTAIDEITTSGKDVSYRVAITRNGKIEHYTVNGYGQLRDEK